MRQFAASEVQRLSQENRSTSSTEQEPKAEAPVVASFRQFTSTELEKISARKQAIAKRDKENKIAELKKFSEKFKVSKRQCPFFDESWMMMTILRW
jgi:PAB1-binding protein PBP1